MKKKILFVLCALGILVWCIFFALLSLGFFKKPNKIASQGVLTEEPVIESLSDEDILYAYNNYPRIVLIKNLSELADSELSSYALNSLEAYLDRYMRYYITTEPRYNGYIKKNSYYYDINFPSFTVHIEELDMDIDCIYNVCTKRYRFSSELDNATE